MTVEEIINILTQLPKNAQVCFKDNWQDEYQPVKELKICKDYLCKHTKAIYDKVEFKEDWDKITVVRVLI